MAELNAHTGDNVRNAIERNIEQQIVSSINKATFNKWKSGVVLAVNGKNHSIKIEGYIYTNIKKYKHIGVIKIGDTVDLLVPNNNMSNIRIIGVIDT